MDTRETSGSTSVDFQEGYTHPRLGLEPFLEPQSVAVIGATERAGSWGSVMMEGLLGSKYQGRIYPVNRRAKTVYGIPAFPDVGSIPYSPELAILTIPEDSVEEVIHACGKKGVRGITIITAGFGEVSKNGHIREDAMARIAKSYGMRILGPNVSGSFNLNRQFNATRSPSSYLIATPLAAISQGGYAFSDVLASGYGRGMGVGKFVHTGNECDLQVTDFLEYFANDPEVK
jgi:acyl-CoA synthetase (NDP forming)